MSCPTCGHTMHTLGCRVTDRPFHWCPRCGTIRTCEMDDAVPALVERTRNYDYWLFQQQRFELDPGALAYIRRIYDKAHALGIRESIWPPDQRPATEE